MPEDKNRLGCLLKVKIPGPPFCGPISGGLEWGPGNLCNLNYHSWASYPQVSLGKVDMGISLQISDLGVRNQCFTTGLRKEVLAFVRTQDREGLDLGCRRRLY